MLSFYNKMNCVYCEVLSRQSLGRHVGRQSSWQPGRDPALAGRRLGAPGMVGEAQRSPADGKAWHQVPLVAVRGSTDLSQ